MIRIVERLNRFCSKFDLGILSRGLYHLFELAPCRRISQVSKYTCRQREFN
nr:MAG TPA: hypothetical protein [Caudoviricetes sp.]